MRAGLRWGRGGGGFRVASSQGEFAAGALVVRRAACRFRSWGYGLGYELARFGLKWLSRGRRLCRWCWVGLRRAGRSWPVCRRSRGRSCGRGEIQEKVLVTHRGLSGRQCCSVFVLARGRELWWTLRRECMCCVS